MSRPQAIVLGASKEGGTGWAVAERLAVAGFHVVAAARRREGIEKLARKIAGTAVPCDVTDEAQVAALVAATGPLLSAAVLVAGEGVRGSIDEICDSELQRAVTLNLLAPVYFLRHVARRIRHGGGIVMMSSIAATNPWPGYFSYGAAKAGLQTLVRYAALEYAPRRIRVNAVVPGPIETPTASALFSNEALRSTLYREVPLGRTAITDEVAEAAVWLATRARSITGECIHVDGGMHLRRPPFPEELEAALQSTTR